MVFITGFLMGAAYVLPPGPVTVETVRRSLLGGLLRRSPSSLAPWPAD
jgi:hypothetical protein